MSKFKYIRRWEITGIFWIIIVGSLLHFTYELSGNSKIVALFSTVNESLWEHLKLGYFSLAIFMLIEYWFVKDKTTSFFIAKLIGIVSMSLFIVIIYYSYHAITDQHNLIVDIGSFVIGAILCQLISFRILKIEVSPFANYAGIIIFVLIGIIFMIFTFYPPHLPIFMDSSTSRYGIDKK